MLFNKPCPSRGVIKLREYGTIVDWNELMTWLRVDYMRSSYEETENKILSGLITNKLVTKV